MMKFSSLFAVALLATAIANGQDSDPFQKSVPRPPGDRDVVYTKKIDSGEKGETIHREFKMKVARPDGDLFKDLFQPDQIMRNQKALALSDEQSSAIKTEVHEAEAAFFDLQWEQKGQEENLKELLKQPLPEEQQAMDQLDRLLTVENSIKKVRLKHLIKVKSLLTSEQQAKLKELIKTNGPEMDLFGAGGGGIGAPETGTVFYRRGPRTGDPFAGPPPGVPGPPAPPEPDDQ